MHPILLQRRLASTFAAVVAFAAASAVSAQSATTLSQPTNTQEFGLDAGALFGLGDRSSVQFTLPAARARIGFFLNNNSRWSIEPAAGLAYTKVKDVPYLFAYNLEMGALYHFRAPSDLISATRARVAYLRPFAGFAGVATGGDDGGSDNVSASVRVTASRFRCVQDWRCAWKPTQVTVSTTRRCDSARSPACHGSRAASSRRLAEVPARTYRHARVGGASQVRCI